MGAQGGVKVHLVGHSLVLGVPDSSLWTLISMTGSSAKKSSSSASTAPLEPYAAAGLSFAARELLSSKLGVGPGQSKAPTPSPAANTPKKESPPQQPQAGNGWLLLRCDVGCG